MNDLFKHAVSLSLLGKCVAAVVGILFIQGTFRVLEQTLPRHFGRADARYKVRKFLVFSSPSSLRIAWAASALPLVSSARVWQSPSRTWWPALPALSPSVFQSCMPWETECRSATLKGT